MMRDLYKALAEFEAQFEKEYDLSLNEAMILCALQEVKEEMTSTALSARTGMAASHTSKVIRAVEGQDPHVCAVVLHGSLLNKGFVLGRLYPPARKKSTGTQFPS